MESFQIFSYNELDTESKSLIAKASQAADSAYAPYSKFHVGAAILLEDGTIITGSNQENAAYPSGMCAERVALYACAASAGSKRIQKLVVIAKRSGNEQLLPATSCGPCRQVMLEFEQRQTAPYTVVMQGEGGKWIVASSAQSLLPFSFSKDALDVS